jgi:hypothetical protein
MGRADRYGIDFIPAGALRNRPIVIDKRMSVSIHGKRYRLRYNFDVSAPAITLLEFLYSIFY